MSGSWVELLSDSLVAGSFVKPELMSDSWVAGSFVKPELMSDSWVAVGSDYACTWKLILLTGRGMLSGLLHFLSQTLLTLWTPDLRIEGAFSTLSEALLLRVVSTLHKNVKKKILLKWVHLDQNQVKVSRDQRPLCAHFVRTIAEYGVFRTRALTRLNKFELDWTPITNNHFVCDTVARNTFITSTNWSWSAWSQLILTSVSAINLKLFAMLKCCALIIEWPGFNLLNHFPVAKKMFRFEFCCKPLWYPVGKDLTFYGNCQTLLSKRWWLNYYHFQIFSAWRRRSLKK